MTQRNTQRGFTLIELLVVVLIVGLLAAVALPQYNKAVKLSQGAEALAVIDAYEKASTAYYLEHGTYEGINAETLGVDMPKLKYWKYGVHDPSSPTTTSDDFTVYVTDRYCPGYQPCEYGSYTSIRLTLNAHAWSQVSVEWKDGKANGGKCTGQASNYLKACQCVLVGTSMDCFWVGN